MCIRDRFFRDAVAAQQKQPPAGAPSPSASPDQFQTPSASIPTTPFDQLDTGDDRQRLAKSRIAVAELRMETERLRDALVDADVERKAAEMELQAVRKQSKENGAKEANDLGKQIAKLERDARGREQQFEHENQTVLSTQCQEAQLQNRALASQVVELENQVMQSHTALNAWNALNAS
eukprot:TRINITY_DN4674_c0_g1_i3.p1 TRINITY_DN4674_c0_g1~~TRINITY_DN4674_c0_g1_i3.p1  ORF type:complete len:178 (+),score=35.59 TRINITY_DN4674_c0_g1_i3:151-684(+)